MQTHQTSRNRLGHRMAVIGLGMMIGLGAAGTASAEALAASDTCGPLQAIALPDGQELCTHGDDHHLAGSVVRTVDAVVDAVDQVATDVVDAVTDVAPVRGVVGQLVGGLGSSPSSSLPRTSSEAPVAAAEGSAGEHRSSGPMPALRPTCVGNGKDGLRVQVVAIDVTDNDIAAANDVDLRRWAGQVEWTFVASAQRDGAVRNVRWATHATSWGCELDVIRLRMTSAQVDGFQAMVASLIEAGLDDDDTKYLAFVASDQVCGLGTVSTDDKPGQDNAANHLAGYSRIDAPCWRTADAGFYSVPAHELTHNLGAVQLSAPNSNGYYHCNDEWDLMCYAEGDNDVVTRCVDADGDTAGRGDENNRLLDCNGDDYFNASDDVRGHLATHWNVANSQHLLGAPTAERQPEPQPEADDADDRTDADDSTDSDDSDADDGEAGEEQPSNRRSGLLGLLDPAASEDLQADTAPVTQPASESSPPADDGWPQFVLDLLLELFGLLGTA